MQCNKQAVKPPQDPGYGVVEQGLPRQQRDGGIHPCDGAPAFREQFRMVARQSANVGKLPVTRVKYGDQLLKRLPVYTDIPSSSPAISQHKKYRESDEQIKNRLSGNCGLWSHVFPCFLSVYRKIWLRSLLTRRLWPACRSVLYTLCSFRAKSGPRSACSISSAACKLAGSTLLCRAAAGFNARSCSPSIKRLDSRRERKSGFNTTAIMLSPPSSHRFTRS